MAAKQKYFLSSKAAPIGNSTVSHQIVQFGRTKGATSYYQLGKLFDLADSTMKLTVENERVSEHEFAVKLANKMGLIGKERKDFFLKAGWLEDKDHAIEALRDKKAPLWMAITSMYKAQGKSEEDMHRQLGVVQGTFHGWCNQNIARRPPRDKMLAMAGEDCFNLNRQETKTFLEAGEHFLDKAHVVDALRQKRISPAHVIKHLIEAEAGSVKEYAEKIAQKPNTVFFWSNTRIPRDRLINLINGLSIDDQRTVMESRGRYLDAVHIATRLKASSNPSDFVNAFKDVYDLTSDNFGISKTSVTKHQSGSQRARLESMAIQFTTVENEHPDVSACWEAYKTTCARYAGHADGSHASHLFKRELEAERQQKIKQR